MIVSPRHVCAGAWLFGGLIGVTMLAQLTAGMDWHAVATSALRVPSWVWIFVAASWIGSFVIRAWRLQREWSPVRHVDFGQCLRLVVLHGAALMLMPIRLGEVGYVVLVHREWRVDVGRAARSLIWMRWQDATILVTLGIALLAPLSGSGRVALVLATLLLGGVVVPGLSARALSGWPLMRRWRGAVAEHRLDMDGWIASLGNWLVRLGAVALLMQHLTTQSNDVLLGAAAGIEISGMLPLQGLAGAGTYEAAAWLAARWAGGGATAVLGAALVTHVFSIVVTLSAAAVARWTWPPGPALVGRPG